ncbi:Chloramphenicol phosphotransferase-like protein [Mycena sanguinolenta]|uniref:Chloramphenicol phosphotransferase-like protein n=1 Tax=Mycena sanguinolenta TaxID=230812 RepID=A0A8H6XQ11_9AGAR|nr:Chloramphenicol phosphotransferase-like protein [Mycena sanguinolenta]
MMLSSDDFSPSLLQTKAQSARGMVVVLNGFPGAGKLTILQQAKALLPPDKTRLLDNHLIIDPVQALFPDRSDEHHRLRRCIRKPVFDQVRELAQKGYIILMTACLAEDEDGVLHEHLDIVRGTDVPLLWINAQCDLPELERRVGSPERHQGSKTKLTDLDVLKKLVSENRLIEPHEGGDGSIKLVVETIDISGSVEESVTLVMKLIVTSGGVEII